MKNLKKLLIILLVASVMILTAVVMLSNNKIQSMVKSGETIKNPLAGEGDKCPSCNIGTLTLKHSSSEHWYECTRQMCQAKISKEEHNYNASGNCTVCGNSVPNGCPTCNKGTLKLMSSASEHWYQCSEETCRAKFSEQTHSYSNGSCTTCGYTTSTDRCPSCQLGTLKLNRGINEHWYECAREMCKNVVTSSKEAHTYNFFGVCTVCDYKQNKCPTCNTGTLTLRRNSSEHWYQCSEETCQARVSEQSHSYNDSGFCTVCQYDSTNCPTCQLGTLKLNKDKNEHWYECARETCKSVVTSSKEAHSYDTSGVCTVCEYKKEDGGSGGGGTTPGCSHTYDAKDNDENEHWNKCSKCGEEEAGTREDHKEASHDNEGKCTVCEYQYEKHEKSETVKEYKTTETGHTPVYTCTFTDCEGTHDGEEEAHTGASHDTEGKCTVEGCEYQYEKHEPTTEAEEYEKTEDGHKAIYKCTFEGCTGTHEGTLEAHTGASHDTDGKCTVCEYKCQIHGKSSEVKQYTKTETTHTPEYECLFEGCTSTYVGEAENHLGASHDNEGKCTVCEYQCQIHGKSETIKEYKKNADTHTPVYKCTYQECGAIYEGNPEQHTVTNWEDAGNGVHTGKCSICEYVITGEHNFGDDGICDDCDAIKPKEECVHEYEITNNSTDHWYICSKCEAIKEGSLEEHKYANYTDNEDGTHSATCEVCEYELTERHNYGEDGTCDNCDAIDPDYKPECEHTYTQKNDETQHWEICTICSEEKEGSRANHTFANYVDNKDGTHSATCEVCKYKMTEKHSYEEDGKCDDCDEINPDNKTECEHTYTQKNDETQHWEICTICNEEKEESRANHTFANYVDNEDGSHSATCEVCKYKMTEKHTYEDGKCSDCGDTESTEQKPSNNDTTTNQKYPQAGANSVAVLLIITLFGVLGISIFKMNKYKNI